MKKIWFAILGFLVLSTQVLIAQGLVNEQSYTMQECSIYDGSKYNDTAWAVIEAKVQSIDPASSSFMLTVYENGGTSWIKFYDMRASDGSFQYFNVEWANITVPVGYKLVAKVNRIYPRNPSNTILMYLISNSETYPPSIGFPTVSIKLF